MVTYIIGKAYDKKILRRNIKKNCRMLIVKKKIVFSRKQAIKTLAPPPPRYLMVRPLCHCIHVCVQTKKSAAPGFEIGKPGYQ